VEFFDEKLNALFMAWLLDHGIKPSLMFIIANCQPHHVLSLDINPLKCSGVRWLHLELFSAIQV